MLNLILSGPTYMSNYFSLQHYIYYIQNIKDSPVPTKALLRVLFPKSRFNWERAFPLISSLQTTFPKNIHASECLEAFGKSKKVFPSLEQTRLVMQPTTSRSRALLFLLFLFYPLNPNVIQPVDCLISCFSPSTLVVQVSQKIGSLFWEEEMTQCVLDQVLSLNINMQSSTHLVFRIFQFNSSILLMTDVLEMLMTSSYHSVPQISNEASGT